jgi:hypothetical protein
VYDVVLRLAAASEGASPALVSEALALTKPAESEASIWPSIALAEREHKTSPVLYAQARKEFPSFDKALLPFANETFLKSRALAETALAGLPPEYQRSACVMALVRSAELAPAPCRKLAKSTLFASQRPYFR